MSRSSSVVAVSILLLAAAPELAAQPDPHEIVRRAVAAYEGQNDQIALRYSFIEHVEKKDLDTNGRVEKREIKTHEVFMCDGTPIRRLIAEKGRPLSPEELHTNDEGFRKALEARKKESPRERAKRIREFEETRTRYDKAIREIPDAFQFKLLGEEPVNGRAAWVIEAAPKPGYRPIDRYSKLYTQVHGRLWIDRADHQWVRLEAELLDPIWFGWILVRIGKGARVKMERMKVDDVWVPRLLWYTASARVGLILTYTVEEEFKYQNYKELGPESVLAGRARRR